MANVLEEILTRICAAEKEQIAGSVAYRNAFVATQDSLYWTNQIEILPETILGTRYAQYGVRVTARLHRGKFTELGTNTELEPACRGDLQTMAAYFASANGRDFLSTEYPTRYGGLAQNSALYQGGVIAQIQAPDGTAHIGTIHTFTFAYRETGV